MVSAFQKTVSVFFLCTAISLVATANTTRRTANTATRQLFSPKSPTTFGKAVRLSEKWYDFFTATAVSYSGTANTATATAIPRAGTALSRTYLICERLVKRLWNVGNAPAHPRALYLQGFHQICERWNLFFEKQFSLLAQQMASRENKL